MEKCTKILLVRKKVVPLRSNFRACALMGTYRAQKVRLLGKKGG